MANFRKILATISTVAILSTLVVTTAVSAASYTDVPADSWAKSYIDNLADLGVFTGEGKFRPADNMSRAEFVKSVVVAAGLEGSTAITFPDVKDGDWFAPYVKTAVANGVISGYANGNFGPNDSLTREQAAKIVVNAFDLPLATPEVASFSDVKSTAWSYSFVETLVSYGIVSGYGNGKFGPADNVTREQVAKIVSLALSPEAPVPPVPPIEVTGGDLGVVLSAETPDAVTLPAYATAASVFAIDLTAGDTDVTFNGFTVHKKGVGALAAAMQAYLYDGDDRLTAGKSLNSSTNNIEFSNVGLKVDAGTTKTIMMKIDVDHTLASGEVQFELVDAASVKSTADSATGDFPVVSETIGLSTTDVGTITIAKNGSTTNPKVGEVGATVAKFTLVATTEAAKLQKLGLYVTGTIAGDDVTNLKLYVSGTTDPIAEVDGINANDLAQFILDTPYEIEKGGTKSFYVTADMAPGRNADTLAIYIDENTDIEAIGATYGFGMAVTKTLYMNATAGGVACASGAQTTCSFSTLEGGDITITSSGPTATDVAVNSKDVHLMDFSIVSVSDVTFKNLDVHLTPGSLDATAVGAGLLNLTTANYTDIKIINTDTGETLMGPVDVTSFKTTDEGTTAISETDVSTGTDGDISSYLFTDEFSMAAGETLHLALTTDVANESALSTDTLYATLALAGTYPQIKDVNNKTLTNSASLVPASAITAKTMTIASASLTTALAAVPVAGATTNNSNTYVKGQKNIKFTGISAKCGTASTCKLTDMTLTGYMDIGNDGTFAAGVDTAVYVNTYVGSVWVDDGEGNHVATAKSVSSAGVVTYDSLSYTIPAGKTVVLYVIGDLSSNATAAYNVAFSLASAGITYEDKDGNTNSSSGAVNGTTAPTTYVSTSAGGVLTASVDAATTKDNIAVAGTSDVEIARFKFSGTREAFTVKALSLQDYQLGVATADLGEYDNNITSIKIEYTNSAGTVETKSGYMTAGNAQFSGMDLYLAKDDDAVMKVYATIPTIASGASAGEVIQLNLALNNFEALSGSGGETYKADKLDAGSALLSVGTITWTGTTGPKTPGTADTTMTVGGTETFAVNDLDAALPVGTMLLFDNDGTFDATNSDIMILTTAYADGTLTVTGIMADVSDAEIDAAENIYYALPGTGYLSATNMLQVYETKPTLAVASSSPSGGRSVSTSDEAFAFTVSANAQEKVQIRTAKDITATCVVGYDPGTGNVSPTQDSAAQAIDGASCLETLTSTGAGDAIAVFDSGITAANGGIMGTYTRMSFWIRASDDAEFTDIKYGTTLAATTNPDTDTTDGDGGTSLYNEGEQQNALADTNCTAAVAAGTATLGIDTWHYCDVAIDQQSYTGQYMAFELHEATQLADADTVYFDRVILYNDKITVDLSADDLDLFANMTASDVNDAGLPVYLKEGGSTVATGYVYKHTAYASEGGSASVTFFPISGTDTAIEIAKGTTKTFTTVLSTSGLLAEDASADDPLTFSMDLGSYAGVTAGTPAGDFWWNDTNFSSSTVGTAPGTSFAYLTPGVIKWIGQVTSATLSGSTVRY
jgi:hypothetical protein